EYRACTDERHLRHVSAGERQGLALGLSRRGRLELSAQGPRRHARRRTRVIARLCRGRHRKAERERRPGEERRGHPFVPGHFEPFVCSSVGGWPARADGERDYPTESEMIKGSHH